MADRIPPSIWQFDRLILATLSTDVAQSIDSAARRRGTQSGLALDVGCGKSPYSSRLAQAGYRVETVDIDAETSPGHVGRAEATGLPDAYADLVLGTQVLEHCRDPRVVVDEMFRIVRGGGHVVVAVPHVWFYHPHPEDNWRFTQEGIVRLLTERGFVVEELRSQGGSVLAFLIVNFLVYGAFGRAGAPLYALVNLLTPMLDRLVTNQLFALNFTCVAKRPLESAHRI